MSGSRLTPFQRRLLGLLADIEPHWTLTGGGAMAGVHLGHGETRDLVEPPEQALIEGAAISVDSRHEILASKLATLLERSEVRDLADVKALGWDARLAEELLSLRQWLVEQLTAGAVPE